MPLSVLKFLPCDISIWPFFYLTFDLISPTRILSLSVSLYNSRLSHIPIIACRPSQQSFTFSNFDSENFGHSIRHFGGWFPKSLQYDLSLPSKENPHYSNSHLPPSETTTDFLLRRRERPRINIQILVIGLQSFGWSTTIAAIGI